MIFNQSHSENTNNDEININSNNNLKQRRSKTLIEDKQNHEQIAKLTRKCESQTFQDYQDVNDNNESNSFKKHLQYKNQHDNFIQNSSKNARTTVQDRKSQSKSNHQLSKRGSTNVSIFNEIELKRAPSLFDKYQNDIERQLEYQIHQPENNLQIDDLQVNQNEGQTNNIQQQNTDFKQNSNSESNINHDQQQKSILIYYINFKRNLYIMFEEPMMTKLGSYVHYFIQFFIFLSVALIISDSCFYDDNNTSTQYDRVSSVLENTIFIVFLVEYILRLWVCNSFGESWIHFVKKPLNIIDLISLLPFFIDSIIIAASNYYTYKVGLLRVIRIVRLIRIIRIFKLSRYMKGLTTLKTSLNVSKKYFSFIAATLGVFVIFIATVIYYFEKAHDTSKNDLDKIDMDSNSKIESIPQAIWFVLTTLTTLGYGDKIPFSIPSKIVVGFIVLISQSFVIGLPIAIVGFDFSNVYKEQKEQKKFNKEKEEGIQYQKGNNQKIKELQFMQQRLRKISKTNKLVRELSSRSSKMCYLITKDMVGLYLQVVVNEQKEMQKRVEQLKLTGSHNNWVQLQKFFGKQKKIKMENIKVTKILRSPLKKERVMNETIKTLNGNNTENIDYNQIDDKEKITSDNQIQDFDESQMKINSHFVRANLKKLKTLLGSNSGIDVSSRLGTKIIHEPNLQTAPHSNYQLFHPQQYQQQNFFKSFRTQKSETFQGMIDIKNNQYGNIDNTDYSQSQQRKSFRQDKKNMYQFDKNLLDKSQELGGYQNSLIMRQQQKQGRNMGSRFSGVMHQDQIQKTKQHGGDNEEDLNAFQDQLDFLNEMLMDLVSEDSVILDQKKQELDEYNESQSEFEDENVHFFEIEKTERKKNKQKRILIDGKPKQPTKNVRLFKAVEKVRNQIKNKSVIQEVTESNNESVEKNSNNMKLSLNNSGKKNKSLSASKNNFMNDDENKMKSFLSNSKLLNQSRGKGQNLTSSSFSDLSHQQNLDSSLQIKQSQGDQNEYKSSSSNRHINSNQNINNESFSNRKRAQIKHESYQNLFEKRLSPGEAMMKINKKKPSQLNRAKTMYVKNINIEKQRIDECSDEDEQNTTQKSPYYKKQQPRILKNNLEYQRKTIDQQNYQYNRLLKKANSLNLIINLIEKQIDIVDNNNNQQSSYLNQTQFNLESQESIESQNNNTPDNKMNQSDNNTSIINEQNQNNQQFDVNNNKKNNNQNQNINYQRNLRHYLTYQKKLQNIKHPEKLIFSQPLDQVCIDKSILNIDNIELSEIDIQQQKSQELQQNQLNQIKQINQFNDTNDQEQQNNELNLESKDIEYDFDENCDNIQNNITFRNAILDLQYQQSFQQNKIKTKEIEQDSI